jgi:hypothetical protein
MMPADLQAAGIVAHVTLRLGRLMLSTGPITALVQASVTTLARRLGKKLGF